MTVDSDMAVSIHWGALKKGFKAPLKEGWVSFWVDIKLLELFGWRNIMSP